MIALGRLMNEEGFRQVPGMDRADFPAVQVIDLAARKIRWNCVPRQALAEATQSDGWLSAAECEEFGDLRGNRASAWLAGRAAAKSALLAEGVANDPRELTVLSSDGRGQRNRPEVYVGGYSRGISLSLAHTDNFVAFAWAAADAGLGIDVVEQTKLKPSFASTWLLPSEQESLAKSEDPAGQTLRIWSAKEAAYKAAQTGEAFDPLRAEVVFETRDCGTVRYGSGPQIQTCDVLWQSLPAVLVTISTVRTKG